MRGFIPGEELLVPERRTKKLTTTNHCSATQDQWPDVCLMRKFPASSHSVERKKAVQRCESIGQEALVF